jgi:hypothetical protein
MGRPLMANEHALMASEYALMATAYFHVAFRSRHLANARSVMEDSWRLVATSLAEKGAQ